MHQRSSKKKAEGAVTPSVQRIDVQSLLEWESGRTRGCLTIAAGFFVFFFLLLAYFPLDVTVPFVMFARHKLLGQGLSLGGLAAEEAAEMENAKALPLAAAGAPGPAVGLTPGSLANAPANLGLKSGAKAPSAKQETEGLRSKETTVASDPSGGRALAVSAGLSSAAGSTHENKEGGLSGNASTSASGKTMNTSLEKNSSTGKGTAGGISSSPAASGKSEGDTRENQGVAGKSAGGVGEHPGGAGGSHGASTADAEVDLSSIPGFKTLPPSWTTLHKLYAKEAASGHSIDVLLIGDDITQSWHKAKDAQGGADALSSLSSRFNVSLVAFGIAGDFTARVAWRVKHGELPAPPKPKVIFLHTGSIDVIYSHGDASIQAKNILLLAKELALMRPQTEVVVHSILPLNAARNPVVEPKVIEVNKSVKSGVPVNVRFLDCSGYFMNKETGGLYKSKYATNSNRYLTLSNDGYWALSKCMEGTLKSIKDAGRL